MLPIEVRYLDIVWDDASSVLKLDKSQDSLELEKFNGDEDSWWVETTAFPSVHHYIGFCVRAEELEHTPYFRLADGSQQELFPVKSPASDEVWWIQSSGWDSKTTRHLSEFYRTAGRAELVIQNNTLFVDNGTENFSVAELEYYLSDFKNNLWLIILNSTGVARGSIEKETPNIFNNEVLKIFHEFTDVVEKLIKKPTMYLAETQGKMPSRSVRPVAKTFREYATHPSAKLLTSRVYHEVFDTAENRYIHHCVKRSLYLLKSLSRIASAQERSYTLKIEQEDHFIKALSSSGMKQIDPRVYDNEIATLQGELNELNEKFSRSLSAWGAHPSDVSKQDDIYTIAMGKTYGNSSNSFFVDLLNGEKFKDKYGTYLVLEFDHIVDFTPIQHEISRSEFRIAGTHEKTRHKNSNGNVFFKLKYHEVVFVEIVKHPWIKELTRLQLSRSSYEAKGWVSTMTTDEIKERDQALAVSQLRIEVLRDSRQRMIYFMSIAPVLQKRLASVLSFFRENNVHTRATCPNSMVFIQNPFYSGAKSQFTKLSKLNGLNEHILDSLLAVDEIGLVNIANLYEKWCLLQIIKVLTEIYRFKIEGHWQQILVEAVLQRKTDVELILQDAERQQKIILTYEKTLPSGKRPDFVVDLFYNEYVQEYASPGKWSIQENKQVRLVMDAKFRGRMRESEIHSLVDELYKRKNYSEDEENPVFVIHPSPKVIDERTSPLEWGAFCDYGQSNRNNHKCGSIFVSPSITFAKSIDNLQRLLGLFLQAHSVILNNDRSTSEYAQNCAAIAWHNIACFSCGNSGNDRFSINYSPTAGGNDRWTIQCISCGHLTVKTVCSSCRKTLYKNGPKWTYHRTRAEQTSNVVCPACETFL